MAKKFLMIAALASLATPATAQLVGGDAAACAEGEPAIRVDLSGLKDRTGRLKLELYPATEADFLRDDRELTAAGKPFRRVWAATPASGAVSMCIRVPRPGTYALFFTHDRDGKNKFNFWSDGGGTPGNVKIGRARPRLADSTVTVGAHTATVAIRIQYLHGFPPSFGPLKN